MVNFIPLVLRPIFFWAVRLLLLGAIQYTIYEVIEYFQRYRILQRAAADAFTRMSISDKQRQMATKRARELNGDGEVKGFINKVDHELMYSGLKIKYKWLSTELYLAITSIIYLQLFLIVSIIQGSMVAGLAFVAIVAILQKTALQLMQHIQYSRTEANLLQFMNIIENFALASDDLIHILDRQSYYLNEPLKSNIVHSVIEARNTGDSVTALRNLQDGVQHQFFKQFIRNLEICQRYDTNYKDIIQDSRHVLELELKNQKERQAIYNTGRSEILAMLACGCACIFMLGGVTGGGSTIQQLLNGGMFGTIIIGFCVVTIVAQLYFAFIANIRHR